MERVEFLTGDNIRLVGNYWKGNISCGVLFLHMMPATKESWDELAEMFSSKGFHVLAIDLRGHGGSVGGPDGFKSFSDEEHQKSIADVRAGAQFLFDQGVASESLALVGASISANLALQYLAEDQKTKIGILLSPGLNYRGLQALLFAPKIAGDARIFSAASRDDERSSGPSVEAQEKIMNALPSDCQKKFIIYAHAGHGTDMLRKEAHEEEEPDLFSEILSWVTGE